MVMKGLTWASLKEMPSLIPLFAILGLGVAGAIFYPLRCALKSPDISWNVKKNPEPWNEYSNKHYKLHFAAPESVQCTQTLRLRGGMDKVYISYLKNEFFQTEKVKNIKECPIPEY